MKPLKSLINSTCLFVIMLKINLLILCISFSIFKAFPLPFFTFAILNHLMNISYNWLGRYIDFNGSPEELSKLLTACGLEVESIEPFESVKGGLKGLVVGHVLTAVKHPNADKLTITTVDVGNDTVSQIVCGAPNVAHGQKVIVATPGTLIYPLKGEPFEIKKSKIRGEVSEGMICAEDEIGLGESHEGILILDPGSVPGMAASDYFKIENDYTLSIGLTPNRPDAASHIGMARDLRAVLNTQQIGSGQPTINLKWPDITAFSAPNTPPVISVKIESAACIRYSGVHINNIKVAPSPEWMQNSIKSIGLKPINNIVDITNFVLYEFGQPLHAFDASKIANNEVIVKKLAPGTLFTTLDGVERKLNGSELMICDAKGGMCIAGVFGGLHSGVNTATTEVFLESACFDSVSVRTTSKHHGLKTDASFRFERGTDPNITVTALQRAALLIQEIAGGKITSAVLDLYPHPVADWKVEFSVTNFKKLTGVDLDATTIKQILSWLDIKVISENGDQLQLNVPPYRVDVMREADVVEEILRIYGYDNIPLPAKMNSSLPLMHSPLLEKVRNDIASYLVSNGFMEVMSNSLTRSSLFDSNSENFARIKNPLSQDLDILRPNMLYPLLDIAIYNRNRKRSDLSIFEYGKTYHKSSEGYTELNHLAILLTGFRTPLHWEKDQQAYTIFYLKSIVNNLLVAAGCRASLKWMPGESTELEMQLVLGSGKKEVAHIGLVPLKTLKKFDLDGEVWHADIRLDVLERLLLKSKVEIQEPPKFPEVRRDLSMLLDKSVQYQSLENLAFETEKKLLRDVNLFDVFEGDKIGNDKKSYALSFVLRDDEKTLTDKEIDKVMQRLMENFEAKLGAVIRKG